jgi:hypothetical protein
MTVIGIGSPDQESYMRRRSTAEVRTTEEVRARSGRPTKVDVALSGEIEALIAKSPSLREVAAQVNVHPRTILRRAKADPEFGIPYARARALALGSLFTELENLARSGASPREVSCARQRLIFGAA